MPDPVSELAPIVTFYSYKGGVGRSMAVLNVSALLAARGFRVLVIDFDLEAPGLSHLLEEVSQKKPRSKPCSGVVELLADAKAHGDKSDLFAKPFAKYAKQYTFDYPIPSELKAHKDGELFIMPAGSTDPSYSTRLNDLNLAKLYEEGVGKGLMAHFKQAVQESELYDFIIIDSRTGHSDEAGICTRDLADQLMVVTGFNRQNIAGTASFLTNLRAAFSASGITPKDPVIILSPVPIGEEDMLAKREDAAKERFSEAWGKPLKLDLFIPYHPRLALTEDAYVSARTASYLRDAYNEIESRMLVSLNHLPAPLLRKAKESIMRGKGEQAVTILEKYAKLESSSSKSMAYVRRFPFGWQSDFDLEENDELIKKVLVLPQARRILEIYIEVKRSSHDIFQLAKKLHELKSTYVGVFDQMILASKRPNLDGLGGYAGYLKIDLKDEKTAEVFYERAIEADPMHSFILGDYGQILIGRGATAEGVAKLRLAWQNLYEKKDGTTAEFAYALWLSTMLLGEEEKVWEQGFKFLIVAGFERHTWNFDAMLEQAKKVLKTTDFKYAKALADAFLDESKVLALDAFPRWKKVDALNPELIGPEGNLIG